VLFVYFLICAAQLRMRRTLERESPELIRVQMWLYPWLTYLAMAAIVVVVGSMYFIKDSRSQLVLSFVSLAVVAAAYLLSKRRGAPALTTSEPGSHRRCAVTASTPGRLLVVANRTAATARLLDTVRDMAADGPAEVTLLVRAFPTVFDPEALETRNTLALAIPLLEEATRTTVRGIVGDPDPFAAVQLAMQETSYDEVVISTLPRGYRGGSSATCRSGWSSSGAPSPSSPRPPPPP
jgi:hypothetical protein